jgi:hypothetical protein
MTVFPRFRVGGGGEGAWTADVLPTGPRLNIGILSFFLLTFFFVAATGKKKELQFFLLLRKFYRKLTNSRSNSNTLGGSTHW